MRFSLYIRALLMVGFVLAAVTTAFVVVSSYQKHELLTQELETRLDRLSKLLAVSVADMVWVLNSDSAGKVLSSAQQEPDFVAASIVTQSGEPFVAVGEKISARSPVLTTKTDIRIFDGDKEHTIGQLTVSFSRANLIAAQRTSLNEAILLAVIQLAAVLLITALILRWLIGPLESITDRLVSLAGGELDEEIPGVLRADQIGGMARAIKVFRESLIEISALRDKDAEQAKQLSEARVQLERRVTERTKELRQTSQRLRDVAETTYDRFWEMDKDLRYTAFADAPGSNEFKNLRPVIGMTRWESADVDPDTDDKWRQHRRDMMNHQRFRDFEYSTKDKNGNERYFRISGKPIFDEGGSFTGFRGSATDITEQEKAREVLRRSHDELELKVRERTSELEKTRDVAEAANALKSQLITTMSHELRTPLTSIIGTLRMLSQGIIKDIPEGAADMIAIAYRNSDQLANLVNDILDVEKLSSNALELVQETVNLSDLIITAVELNSGYAELHGVRITCDDVEPDVMVEGDESRLLQVMANLLSNASKFSKDGGEVKTSLKKNGERVVVSVIDQGNGIPDDLKDKIFDKFVRGDTADNRNRGGAGLGLNITKAIVEQHGGRIDFKTKAEVGTTMFFELKASA
jgi:PAS domain S-box-containing protein